MTLGALTGMMFDLSKRGVDVEITFSTINIPDHQRGEIYGTVSSSHNLGKVHRRVFHGEEELLDALKEVAKG